MSSSRAWGGVVSRSLTARALTFGALALTASLASAQTTPAPVVRLTFSEAIRRAQEKNPTVTAAATGILRADALIRQVRAATLVQLTGNVTRSEERRVGQAGGWRCVQGHATELLCVFFSSRRRHTRSKRDWSSDVCSSDLRRRRRRRSSDSRSAKPFAARRRRIRR